MQVGNEQMQRSMLNRLSRIEGQVRGVKKLVAEGEECEKVIQQMTAARRAMDKAFYEMLACVIEKEVVSEVELDSQSLENMDKVKKLLTKYA